MNTRSPYARTTVQRRRPDPSHKSSSSTIIAPSTVDQPDAANGTSKPRKIATENFAARYMELCRQCRVRPLAMIRQTLPHSLDLATDRVKMDDWGPILNALALDRTLRSVTIRSRYQSRRPLVDDSGDKTGALPSRRHKRQEPAVLTRYLLEWLAHSVAECARNSRSLTSLDLEGVPFPTDCLSALCAGLAGATTIRRLGLRRCCIGDAGCDVVCRTVADLHNLRSLDLSECQLTENSADSLAAALSRQKLTLYHETWKESLRYREPDLDAMPGLRRLTLNGNPRLGDRAISRLVEAVRDSLWLKALDLQNCGLSDVAGREIAQLLEHNTTLAIVDVRMNWNIGDETAAEIFRRLEANAAKTGGSGKSIYPWMSLPRGERRNAVSAGATKKNRQTNPRPEEGFAMRPQSAIPYYGQGSKNTTVYGRCARSKCNNNNSNSVTNNNKNNNNKNNKVRVEVAAIKQPKVSLRLDIPRVESSVAEKITQDACAYGRVSDSDVAASEEEDKETVRSVRAEAKEEEEDFTAREEPRNDVAEVNRILRELSEARTEQDRLVEETRRTDELLAEERARRETAESKLRRLEENLSQLEAELKEKERETRGFLLVSQRSLDDIAATFERLLVMLENSGGGAILRNDDEALTAATSSASRRDEYSMARAEIRTRVARFVRKSKSECQGGFRGFHVEREETSVIEASGGGNNVAKIFARSEGDVTCPAAAATTPQPVRLERNIGDSVDVGSTRVTCRDASRGKEDGGKMAADAREPCERARAIFARVVNGDAILRLGGGAHGS